jgi:uncharacterized protein YfaS (alpha-2-macroglobulin family)
MFTFNGIGAMVYGTAERDAGDNTRIGTQFITMLFLPLLPLGAYLYLPAGLEIETLLRPSDGLGSTNYDGTRRNGPFSWIGEITSTQVQEARDDRFVASANLRGQFRYAYIARAVTPGRYTLPAAQVEDMYRPGVMARTSTGAITIAPRGG